MRGLDCRGEILSLVFHPGSNGGCHGVLCSVRWRVSDEDPGQAGQIPAAARQDAPAPDGGSLSGDRDALVALYNATDGPNWRSGQDWLSDAPLDEWYGVTTNASGRVILLHLSKNLLEGEIPPELGTSPA